MTPTGTAASISIAVKAVLLALVSFGLVPLTDDQAGSLALAVATIVDVLIYLRVLKPKADKPAEDAPADEYDPKHDA